MCRTVSTVLHDGEWEFDSGVRGSTKPGGKVNYRYGEDEIGGNEQTE